MNKNFKFFIMLLSFTFVFAAASVNAQKTQKVVAEIPFEFSVGDRKFEAGKYVFTSVSSNGSLKVFHLRGYGKKSSMFIPTVESGRAQELKKSESFLKFNRYGDLYFLAGISNKAERLDAQLMKSGREIQIAKESKPSKKENVSILLTSNK